MKLFKVLTLLFWTVLFFGCTSQSEQELREAFKNPSLKYRLNRNLHRFPYEAQKQDSLIEATLADGWGGFALNTPYDQYLTEKGLAATKRFCDKAKAKGMDLWLYDECGYPSGNAGDLVIKENPDWEAMAIYMKDTLVRGGKVNFLMPWGEPVTIKAFPEKNGETDFKRSIDLIDLYNGANLKWNAPTGQWRIFAATKYRLYEGYQAAEKGRNKLGAHYPSLMIPEPTDAFIRITHETYSNLLGEDLSEYFTSTFTDEPSLMALQFHKYKDRHAIIPWKELLSDEIKKRYGYRPEDKLIELFYNEGADGQKIRYHYFHTVADLTSKNFYRKIKDWCEEHNFLSGGHLLLEESMIAHVPLYGDIMKCFREMHSPGIDILSCLPENMPVHTPKLASSAMELIGGTHVMSEPCPVADRPHFNGLDPETPEVRGHLNILLQGGITDFNCYLKMNNSTEKERVEMNNYVGRIQMLLRNGYVASEIGVLYPIESMWTEFMPRYHKVFSWYDVHGAREKVNTIDKTFQGISRFMFENCWEYTHLDAKAITDSKVEDGTLKHKSLQFKVLVLPYVSTLSRAAWEKLEEFAVHGGKIIAFGDKPLNSEDSFPDKHVQQTFTKLFKENNNVVFLEEWTSKELKGLLDKWLIKPINVDGENLALRLAHRKIDGKDVIFIINDSDKEIVSNISFNTKGEFEQWDPVNGEVEEFGKGGKLCLEPYHGKVYRTK
ncbi:glycosyl hydrolase [uncultured Draconibacterium sp.]|uniref:glycosyl hydrolase n=1 Tax=uncultured Draconibacterium sp. TaxID=1573823 RepID=UPI003261288A